MKKYAPYIIALLLTGGVIALFLTGENKKKRKLDERITLRRHDKIPYGTYVAYKGLAHLFPKAIITTTRDEPGYWDSISATGTKQALVIIAGKFNADEAEMKHLVHFIEKGNDVFISASSLSHSAGDMMNCKLNNSYSSIYDEKSPARPDSLKLSLLDPPFGGSTQFVYPGKKLDAYFETTEELSTEVLGTDANGQPDFIRLRAGKGNMYVHLAPLAFSNYFILHKNNIAYFEKALSVLDSQTTRIAWDEYYVNKKFLDDGEGRKKGWFSVLMSAENGNGQRSFRAAFWVLLLLMLAYVLIEMRRRQRFIPLVAKPRNDSMDFVRTIGRLYFDKGDHKNLSRKMSAYFLEHVRTKYKLLTGSLDEEFTRKLQHKSGVAEHEIRGIISFIKYLDDAPGINHRQLADFHRQLEDFYKKA